MLETAMGICEQHKDEMIELFADTAFSFARYGEEINMNPQRVYQYCLQFHQLSMRLDDGSRKRIEDVATSHTSLAQGFLLLDNPAAAVAHCKRCIEIEESLGEPLSQFAHIYGAWGLYGLQKYDEASTMSTKVIEYRKKTFGENDKQSIK